MRGRSKRQNRFFVTDPQRLAFRLVMLQPIAPNPLMKMIRRDGTVSRPARRSGLLHEIGEVCFELGEMIARGNDIEHVETIPESVYDKGYYHILKRSRKGEG